MAGLTSIIAGVGTAVGVGSTISKAKSAGKSRKQAHWDSLRAQVAAWEAARLTGPKQANTRVKVGAPDREERAAAPASAEKGTAKRKTKAGVGGFQTSAATIGGL